MTKKKKTARAGKPENKFIMPPSEESRSFTRMFQSFVSPSSREDAEVSVRIRSAGCETKAAAMPNM